MGPEIALAMAAGGTGLGMLGQQSAKREQQDYLNRANRRTMQTQDKATRAILDEAGTLAPTARADAMAAQADQTAQRSTADLTSGAALDGEGNAIINTAGDAGAVSSEFMARKADKALSEGNRMTAIARELAKTRAPGELMRTENQRRAALTGDLNSEWSTTRNLNEANQADAASVEEPWWGQMGKLAAAIGSAAAMMPAAGAAGAAASPYSLGGSLPLGSSGGTGAGGFWGNAGRLKFG